MTDPIEEPQPQEPDEDPGTTDAPSEPTGGVSEDPEDDDDDDGA